MSRLELKEVAGELKGLVPGRLLSKVPSGAVSVKSFPLAHEPGERGSGLGGGSRWQ